MSEHIENIDQTDHIHRYQRARPQLFRVGDIVEIQCSIIIVKGKGSKHRMKLVLRAIVLLNCEIVLVSVTDTLTNKRLMAGQEAKRKMCHSTVTEEPKMRQLKRKIGFSEEDSEGDEEEDAVMTK